MKKGILAGMVLLFAVGGLVHAQEGELHGVVDFTYQSKYLWRGIDVYGDKSAMQPSVMLDFGNGLGLSADGHRANSSGFETTERWDFTLSYKNAICPEEALATEYMIWWRYFYFPDDPLNLGAVPPGTSGDVDLQEMAVLLSWPNVLQVEGLVPRYVLVKLWPAESDTFVGSQNLGGAFPGTASGFAHIFMLDYGVPMAGLTPDTPEQVLKLHSEVVFNDGVDPRGIGVDHDWTNAVFGISTDFDLAEGVKLTPGVYYQITMDESIQSGPPGTGQDHDQDETWFTLGLSYNF